MRDNLQQTTIPSLGKASLSLDGNLFAIDPVVTKQKSTTVRACIRLKGRYSQKSLNYIVFINSTNLYFLVLKNSRFQDFTKISVEFWILKEYPLLYDMSYFIYAVIGIQKQS